MNGADLTVEGLLALVEAMADLPYGGELIDQRAHALQAAALAEDGGDALVAAALLHDIGYSEPVRQAFPGLPHEESAARWLRPRLGEVVASLVAAHVSAKRYLVRVDADYASLLSAASISSLRAQGGPASDGEVVRWEALPWWADAVALRHCDDAAKVVGLETAAVSAYRPALLRLAIREQEAALHRD